jgi:aspartate racemase
MSNKNFLLGVLGGLGPMSTVYFCELITAHTQAFCDADHVDMLISSRASTPDRTAFILGKSQRDPLPVMIEDAQKLTRAGADLIVIPCNTAHYFYNGLKAAIDTPMLNIIEETLAHLARIGTHRFGLLATEGTIKSRAYENLCADYGLTCIKPTAEEQAVISSIIYDSVKRNKPVDLQAFLSVADSLCARGCEKLVLGCTELSLIKRQYPLPPYYIDSLDVLADSTIRACGKTPVGFDFTLDTKRCGV